METLLFWSGVFCFWLFFHLTTANQRERLFYRALTAVALVGATGFVWELVT